jgi:hypothetical protein
VSERVQMRDPNSPDSPPYEAEPSQVPFLAAAGWVPVEDEPETEQADGGESDGEKTKSKRPRASAAEKKGDS